MGHVWEKSYPSGVHWDCPLPPAVPLERLLETAATTWPDRIAIDFYDRTLTYRELHDLAARAAKGLQTLKIRRRLKALTENTQRASLKIWGLRQRKTRKRKQCRRPQGLDAKHGDELFLVKRAGLRVRTLG
jgi:hypothetical protein